MASLEIPAGWQQGRGAYGGFVVASLIREIEKTVADPARMVRSVTAELPGPVVPGAAEITTHVLRAGNSVSTVRAELVQGGEIKSHAVAVLAATRRGAGPLAWQELVHPAAPPWKSIEPMQGTPGPEFAVNFEYRIVEGIPGTGPSAPARAVGWIRPRAPGGARDAAHIAMMVDAWWPATLVRLERFRPMATIAFTLDILAGLDGLDPDAPLLYRGTVPVMADGYFLETRELWGEDGRLVALNQQTFAIIQ